MSALIWILVIAAIVIALAATFAALRAKQRSGDVLAAKPHRDGGGS